MHFTPSVFVDFIVGYRTVILLMLLGYILHFIPKKIETKSIQWFTNISLVGKTAFLLAIIVLVMQTKSAGIQPFIYFQF
jgi:hypothetical protein